MLQWREGTRSGGLVAMRDVRGVLVAMRDVRGGLVAMRDVRGVLFFH